MRFPRLTPCLLAGALLTAVSTSSAQITIVSKSTEGRVLPSSEDSVGFDIELKPGNANAMLVVGLSYAAPSDGAGVRFQGVVTSPDGQHSALKEAALSPKYSNGMGRLYTMSIVEPGTYRVQFTLENHKHTRLALLGIILANVDSQVAATAYSDPASEDKLGSKLTIHAQENDRIVALIARSGHGKPLECNGWEPLLYAQADGKAAQNGALALLPVESTGEQTVSWTWKGPHARSASCALVLRPAS